MTPDDIRWPVVYCSGYAVFFERNTASIGSDYFGGPLKQKFVGRRFGTEPLHRILTVSMAKLPQPKGHYLQGSFALFYGMRYDGCTIRYRIPVGKGVGAQYIEDTKHQVELLQIEPNESSVDWPYEDYPRLLPYIPLKEAHRTPMAAEEFEEQFTWQGLDLSQNELAVVVPTCPALGMSMWGPWGDAEAVQLVFRYDFLTREVTGSNQCT